ncbi:energy-coupling factor ABC transporter ATP-binding protein [Ruminococcus sp. OA3]|uniref:ABC transporter ATP-binding protein n=1 Tax=Ruminococcus sp. OA3 TaxID=2914164 RepID=UPI001F062676|nr:energy-coupling factor ABC transporter ATP-binding protein [Ruminococcus sp. OA3]MCH1983136.1 energy-coupling factor ABC transporter ATP-binding protein [Ruminococcus sp. OA3]
MITIDHVSFGYNGEQGALYDISLSIKAGECVLLCGESGCGKTTVTKLINGLIPHFTDGCTLTGAVSAAGLLVADTELYELAKSIGSVFQNPKSQFFNLDTDSELAFGLENEGVRPELIVERVEQTVKALNLQNLIHRSIFSLSGGEKQSLALGSVCAMDPSVYVLDEPTANLDEAAIDRLREQIRQLKLHGHTVVIAEHRLYFLDDIIDQVFYLKDGMLTERFSWEKLCRLTREERIRMGLRSITPTCVELPPARAAGGGTGLVVDGLACGYRKGPPVFENLSFAAVPGEVLAVTGRNGAGKTTLTRCLCGLMRERNGKVLLDGRAFDMKNRRRKSFCVMQDVNHQLFYDSVQNECEQAAADNRMDIRQALEKFNLYEFRERHPMALSGGQKQRLAVTTALLSGKQLLIFDEPTSGLDYRHMQEVCTVVRSLAKEGHIVLVVSHDKEFMKAACDRVLEIE